VNMAAGCGNGVLIQWQNRTVVVLGWKQNWADAMEVEVVMDAVVLMVGGCVGCFMAAVMQWW
jgi:hypothetical protein